MFYTSSKPGGYFILNKYDMIDYEQKYLELTGGFMKCADDVSNEFPEANGFEKSIIALRKEG